MVRVSTTIEKIHALAQDGEWKTVDDLRNVSSFPEEWLKELRHEGYDVREDEGRFRLSVND
jgi:hypothetical protein